MEYNDDVTRHQPFSDEVPFPADDGEARARANERARARAERLDAQNRGRRNRTLAAIVVLVVVLVLVTAGGAFALRMAGRGAAAAETPSATVVATQPASAPASVSASPATPTAAVTVVATPTAPVSPTGLPAAAFAAQVKYPGAPPVTPVVIFDTHPKQKLVAITLDDGIPIDPRLLDLFEQRNVHVTTFLLGQAVVQYPKLVARMHRDGIEIAVHGWDHKSFARMSTSEMRSQLNRTQKVITKITGVQAPYFRPPYGAKNSKVVHVAAEEGYKTVLWDDSFVDTAPAAWPEYSYKKAMLNLHPGAIILCHWGHPKATYGAMKLLLDELDRQGYRVVTISELLAESPPVKPYRK